MGSTHDGDPIFEARRLMRRGLGAIGRALGAVDRDLPIRVFVAARAVGGAWLYLAGTVLDEDMPKMWGLRGTAELALGLDDLDRAAALARELLDVAERHPTHWDYGNAVHHGHLILGTVALRRGNRTEAAAELLAAGRARGSPQLNSFGPNMRLARDLLEAGERDAVLEYLELCATFWKAPVNRLLPGWTEQVRRGERPDFAANLLY